MRRSFRALAALAVLLAACDDDDNGTNPDTLTMSFADPSGNVQTGAPDAELAPFRVRLVRGSSPAEGVVVNWVIANGTGSLNVPTSTTDADGIAEAVLTLGSDLGVVTVTATATDAVGSPLTFTATAEEPGTFEQVEVRNNVFDPDDVTIDAGGTVAFVWPAGALDHNIVPVAPATTPNLAAITDGPFVHEEIFNTAGTYQYFCSQHGSATTGMRGQIVVQ